MLRLPANIPWAAPKTLHRQASGLKGFIDVRRLLSIFFCTLLLAGSASAQGIRIHGNVRDSLTLETIPNADIVLLPSGEGTLTDVNGDFTLLSANGNDSMMVTFVGYKPYIYHIGNAPDQEVHVMLQEKENALAEVVIHAGEDPSIALMKQIIRHKKANNPDKLPFYSESVYNKVEVDLTNFGHMPDSTSKHNPFEFIWRNIDTSSDVKPFLPFFLTESLSDYYFRKNPHSEKEIIKATRVSGVDNESVSQFIGSFYQRFNIYENYFILFDKNFISPVSDVWNIYYRTVLEDSGFIGSNWCYKISFFPRLKQENVFSGDIWFADTSFAIIRVSMDMDSDANINFLHRVSFYQEFSQINDTTWLLSRDKMVAEFNTLKNSTGFIGRRTAIYNNFSLDEAKADAIFRLPDDIIVSDTVVQNNDSFWQNRRPEELSPNEKKIYSLVDSIKKVPAFQTIQQVFLTLVQGYWDLHYVEVGPYFKIFSQNEVEGVRLRLGLKTGDKISKRFVLEGYGAYGFNDAAFKYGGTFDYILAKKPRQKAGIGYQNDLDVNSDNVTDFGEDNILSNLYRRKNIPQKIIQEESEYFYYERDWIYGLSSHMSVTHTIMNPLFDMYYYNIYDPDDTLSKRVNNTEFSLQTRFAYHERFIYDGYWRSSLGTTYPIVTFTYSMALRNVFDCDFTYHKFAFTFYDSFHTGSFGSTDYTIKAGKIMGRLPTLLLENPSGNETYFYSYNSFNLMNEYEFSTDTYAELFFAHHFDGFFLNKIPLLRLLKLREIVTYRLAWGTLSDQNKQLNAYYKEMPPYYLGNSAPYPLPYMEAGVGIENIFKLFRVDAIWRLTYRHNPLAPDFGIRVGADFDI